MPSKKEIAALISEYEKTRNERLEMDERSKKMKVREDAILDSLTAAKVVSGVYGSFHATVKTKKVPRCTDWPGFHAYLRETGNLDMLHKRLTETAVMARLLDGEYVPGIVQDDKIAYTFTIA